MGTGEGGRGGGGGQDGGEEEGGGGLGFTGCGLWAQSADCHYENMKNLRLQAGVA